MPNDIGHLKSAKKSKKDEFYNYPIGILGASLSAFDVVSSLTHRHGKFVEEKGVLKLLESAVS